MVNNCFCLRFLVDHYFYLCDLWEMMKFYTDRDNSFQRSYLCWAEIKNLIEMRDFGLSKRTYIVYIIRLLTLLVDFLVI